MILTLISGINKGVEATTVRVCRRVGVLHSIQTGREREADLYGTPYLGKRSCVVVRWYRGAAQVSFFRRRGGGVAYVCMCGSYGSQYWICSCHVVTVVARYSLGYVVMQVVLVVVYGFMYLSKLRAVDICQVMIMFVAVVTLKCTSSIPFCESNTFMCRKGIVSFR